MPVISFSLDTASINKAVRDLRRYVNSFEAKVALVRQRVAERIRWSAETGFSSAMVEDIIHGVGPENDVTVELQDNDRVSVVIASGSQAVFIEFGAGVYYNGAVGSSPYTATITSSDKYVITLAEALAVDTEVKVETFEDETNKGCRAILFGIQAAK